MDFKETEVIQRKGGRERERERERASKKKREKRNMLNILFL